MGVLTISGVYAAACTNPSTCRNHACCEETTEGAKPYFNGSVCTSIPQTNNTGSDCDYNKNGATEDDRIGIKIGSMCVSKKNASSNTMNWSWCRAVNSSNDTNTCPFGDHSICGVTGARIPTIDQLQQIMQVFYSNPAIRAKLNMTTGANYWSLSEYGSTSAWYVNLSSGYAYRSVQTKPNGARVRCIK